MGSYAFAAAHLYEVLLTDFADPRSSGDFGKDIIPAAVRRGHAVAHSFSLSCVSSDAGAEPYWRDVGTIDAYWSANLDLCGVDPSLDLYDTSWPIWTYQEQLPPAKFVFDDDERRGAAIDSLVSGGCIVSGSTVRRSLLFSRVRVNSYCRIKEALLLPDVDVGRHARLSKVVVDRGCRIPPGLVVGEDAEEDARRFHRTDQGVVLITRDMLAELSSTPV